MFTSISVGIGDLPCFPNFFPNRTYTASKERMVPKLMFSPECVPQLKKTCFKSAVAITLCFQLCSECYTVLQTKNSVRIISVVSPVTT